MNIFNLNAASPAVQKVLWLLLSLVPYGAAVSSPQCPPLLLMKVFLSKRRRGGRC